MAPRNPFLIIKTEDVRKYCRGIDMQALLKIAKRVTAGRQKDGLELNQHYIVISADAPYADEVTQIIRDYEESEETAKEIQEEMEDSE